MKSRGGREQGTGNRSQEQGAGSREQRAGELKAKSESAGTPEFDSGVPADRGNLRLQDS